MTFSHFKGKLLTYGGFAQKVPLPSNPTSNAQAFFHSCDQTAIVSFAFGTATGSAYTIALPKGAILKDFTVLVTTAFVGTTPAIEVGNTAAASDLMASTALTANAAPIPEKALVTSADGQTVYVTVTGTSLTAGAGYLLIGYFNPPTTDASY